MIVHAVCIDKAYAESDGMLRLHLLLTQAQMHDALIALMAELDPDTRVAWLMEANKPT